MSSFLVRFGWMKLDWAKQRAVWLVVAISTVLQAAAAAQEPAASVRMTVDFGDGVQKTFSALVWKDKMTVFNALQAAEKHPRGIKFAHTGSGDTTFITGIDDAMNEGADGRNWRYTVNDQPARYSSAVAELKAGDTVVWRFEK
jgi:hypothetical protein